MLRWHYHAGHLVKRRNCFGLVRFAAHRRGSRKVVGVLTGGFASCQDSTGQEYYGRLSAVQILSSSRSCVYCCQHC